MTSVYHASTLVPKALAGLQSYVAEVLLCERCAAPPVKGDGRTTMMVANIPLTFSVLGDD